MYGIVEDLLLSVGIWSLMFFSERVSDNRKEYIDNKLLYSFTWLWHFGRGINVASLICGVGVQLNVFLYLMARELVSDERMSAVRIIYIITLLETFFSGIIIGLCREGMTSCKKRTKILFFGVAFFVLIGLVLEGKPYIIVFEEVPVLSLLAIGLVCGEIIGGIIYVLKTHNANGGKREYDHADMEIKIAEKQYCIRETVDIREQRRVIESAGKHVKYKYLYSTSKRMPPSKLVIFLPEAYGVSQDVDGNLYDYNKLDGWKMVSNAGAYQELSDCLVRAGYATLRCERMKEQKILKEIQVSPEDIFAEIPEFQQFDGEIYVLAHSTTWLAVKELTEQKQITGLISLCGAGAGQWDRIIRYETWEGSKPQKVKKKYAKLREPVLEEFIKLAMQMPIFVGYVECDPYYDNEMVEAIKRHDGDSIEYHYYPGTDFTLRFKMRNLKKGVTGMGHTPSKKMEPLNPEVSEMIIAWIEREK